MKMMNMKLQKNMLPDLGEIIETPHGKGKVVGLNILERVLQIELMEQEQSIEYTLEEINKEGAVSIQATD